MRASHRIRRQRWQVSTTSPADAFAVRSVLRRDNELSLLPVLEGVFAELDDGRHDIHLPRLDLAIHVSSADKLLEELPAKLAAAARQALAAALLEVADGPLVVARDSNRAGPLRRYLQTGQLAWFDAPRESAELLAELAGEAGQWSVSPDTSWPQLLAELPRDGVGRSSVFMRFLQLLEAGGRAAWSGFLVHLAARRGGSYPAVLAALRQLEAGRPADHVLRLQALGMLLLASDLPASSRPAAWSDAVHACAAALGTLAASEQQYWQQIEFPGMVGIPLDSPVAPGAEADSGAGHSSARLSPAGPSAEYSSTSSLEHDAALGLPLRSAGLVLLHPYLPRLFSALGWVSAGHPVGQPFPPACLARAASLLNWLASGRDEAFEFELGMAKLLLGLHPDDALPVGAGLLGAAERDEGEALLAAVIAHWPALGKTSIEGLRVAFLQRGGLLYPATDGWLLRPQGESYDMLLKRLPWGLSVIRLAWMPRLLHTEWSAS
ncbi:MAG: contractile injection system tape measure protein [Azonexus sp.]